MPTVHGNSDAFLPQKREKKFRKNFGPSAHAMQNFAFIKHFWIVSQ